MNCFHAYLQFSVGKAPSKKEFLQNVEAKEQDLNFTGDMEGLLRPEIHYDQATAFNWLKETLFERM